MTAVAWTNRPRRKMHPILGVTQIWIGFDGRFQVERYLGGSRRYIAVERRGDGGTLLIGDFPNLARAQRACQQRALKAIEYPRKPRRARRCKAVQS